MSPADPSDRAPKVLSDPAPKVPSDPAPKVPWRRRTIPAVLVAIILGAAAVTGIVDVISVATSNRTLVWPYEQIATQMRQTTWSDAPILFVGIGIAALGLVLLLIAVLPGREGLVPIVCEDTAEALATNRRSLRRALTRAALDVDGAERVDVKVKRRRARLDVSTPLRDPGDLSERVTAAAEQLLRKTSVAAVPTVSARVQHREHG